jgi:small subunit ribosomal protein S8
MRREELFSHISACRSRLEEVEAMMTDPIGDMLTRIRNAGRVGHAEVKCPSSKLKASVARVLSDEGFVGEVKVETEGGYPTLTLALRYADDGRWMIDRIQRVSRPGRRVYVGVQEVPRVRKGLGMAILSTPSGVMCDRDARATNVGGEVLCEVW